MVTRDVKQIIKAYLTEHLTIEVKDGHWTDPNNRTIVLKLEGEEISFARFDVVQKPEYEG